MATMLGIEPTEEWQPETVALHQREHARLRATLGTLYGTARLDSVIADWIALGPDPWSVAGWHNQLWVDVRDAFVTGNYYAAGAAAGTLSERIVMHLVADLAPDFEPLVRTPATCKGALAILSRWAFLEPGAEQQFDDVRQLRNKFVHLDNALYGNLRARSLEIVSALRDAIDVQFGPFVRRRVIPGVPGMALVPKAVESEPFVRRYVIPDALHVGPHHTLAPVGHPPLWVVDQDPEVLTSTDTDHEFVRLMAEPHNRD